MSRLHKPQVWASEAAMFSAYVAWHQALGFTIYPECCGHDLIMVAPDPLPPSTRDCFGGWGDLRPGDVIAVEGKLRASVDVLFQALPPHVRHRRSVAHWPATPAPSRSADFSVVLVPQASQEYRSIAWACGCVVATQSPSDPEPHANYHADLRQPQGAGLELPDVCVNLTPGHPSPRTVSAWKIKAVRLCLLGAERRDLTAAEVGDLARLFVQRGWLTKEGRGKAAVYRLAESVGRPDRLYPEIVAALGGTP